MKVIDKLSLIEQFNHEYLRHGCDINYCLKNAVHAGEIEDVNLLLLFGADVHYQEDYCLYYAVYHNFTIITELLLEYGADIHCKKNLLLNKLAFSNKPEMKKIFKKHGIDITKYKKENHL